MTLDQFIQQAQNGSRIKNSHVFEPDFSYLYVRYGRRCINSKICFPVLNIGTIEAYYPGAGAFTRLIKRLRNTYPELYIYVENVLNPHFVKKLIALGFTQVGSDNISPSFYIAPLQK
jgi:hypothetical protein